MLSVKRLLLLFLGVTGISALFVLYSVQDHRNSRVLIGNPKIVEKEFLDAKELPDSVTTPAFIVIGSDGQELYRDIYCNVCRLLEDWKVSYVACDKMTEDQLRNRDTILIFCNDQVSEYIDLQEYAKFLEQGGRAIMAGGIAQGDQDSYLWPVLGILEKTIRENYHSFSFEEEFLLLQSRHMVYGGYHMSTWIQVRNAAKVYLRDSEKKVPIVYSYPCGEGMSLVINSTMLSDPRMQGILAAGIGVLKEDFLYPVIGTKSVFLDNFPMVAYFEDEASMKYYGQTTEAFVRDVVWPALLGIAMRSDMKYTASVNCLSNDPMAFPAISRSLCNALGRSALQKEHELAYAANIVPGKTIYKNEAFQRHFAETFLNYKMQALVMMQDCSYREAMDALEEELPAIRGFLGESRLTHRLYCQEQFWVFPAATEGNSLEEGTGLEICSVLTSHGLLSHVFDVHSLMAEPMEAGGWDRNKTQLEAFENRIFQELPFLDAVTLSGTRDYVESYLGMDYSWERNGNVLELTVSRAQMGQSFLLRTEKEMDYLEGGEYYRISDIYGIVKVNSSRVRIHLKEEAV